MNLRHPKPPYYPCDCPIGVYLRTEVHSHTWGMKLSCRFVTSSRYSHPNLLQGRQLVSMGKSENDGMTSYPAKSGEQEMYV